MLSVPGDSSGLEKAAWLLFSHELAVLACPARMQSSRLCVAPLVGMQLFHVSHCLLVIKPTKAKRQPFCRWICFLWAARDLSLWRCVDNIVAPALLAIPVDDCVNHWLLNVVYHKPQLVASCNTRYGMDAGWRLSGLSYWLLLLWLFVISAVYSYCLGLDYRSKT